MKKVEFELTCFEKCIPSEIEILEDYWRLDDKGNHVFRLATLEGKYSKSISALQHIADKKSTLTFKSTCECGNEITGIIRNRRDQKNLAKYPDKYLPECKECSTNEPKEQTVPATMPPRNVITLVFSANELNTSFTLKESIELKKGLEYTVNFAPTTDGKMILNFWEK